MLAKGMGDSSFVHDVRVLAREIDHDDFSDENQVHNVLDDRTIRPNVVGSLASKFGIRTRTLDCIVDAGKRCSEGHHDGNEIMLNLGRTWNLENSWRKGDFLHGFRRRMGSGYELAVN